MKNKLNFQKVPATWKAKSESKAVGFFGLQNIAPSLGQKNQKTIHREIIYQVAIFLVNNLALQ